MLNINYTIDKKVIARAIVDSNKLLPQKDNYIMIEGNTYKVINFYFKNAELSELNIILMKQTNKFAL